MQKSKNIFIIIIGLALIIALSLILIFRDNSILIDINEFQNLISSNSINKMSIDNNYIYINANDKKYKIAKEIINLSELKNIAIEVKTNNSFNNILADIGIIIVVLLGIAVLFNALFRSRKINNNFPIQQAKKESQTHNNLATSVGINNNNQVSIITFNDIAGIKEVKDDLLEIIDYLKNPYKYQTKGIYLPKGILLVGPPGVGKTMIARAIANEAKVPFFYQSGSSFSQIYVGVGAKRVIELFYQAKLKSPSIIFIDEIDAVGKARGGNRSDEREATLNQLLTEMDGFFDSSGVIVLGATNRIDVLDPALLRSGRFDRRIYIDLPDLEERSKIIELYLNGKNHSVDINEIAKYSVGFSGASIASLVNEASLNALRRNSKIITNDDFFISHNKISGGVKKQLSFSDKEKDVISLYQAAKALCACWCEIEFDKVSLIGDAIKNSDKNILSKTDLLNIIKVALSGNVVLEMYHNETYTNCKEDIAIAKEIAREMCETYAMAGRIIVDYSDILEILNDVKDELKLFFTSSKNALLEVQKILLEKEKISKEQLKDILNRELFT
ncbi:AAA family ATPase [Helicobacter sp. MIT 14-3879]|uniref:AAA family ATPase n=1 Tax=Helicobacter sp. MIT 14-3879 TaxID=2040649 RepID=UPI000E1E325D|nr:AAA family ATPase [Helicobacter sp. MIT 14-3879]RDU62437.1 AAA family ATPase [Helicobacter sp. MIT 14-3879]